MPTATAPTPQRRIVSIYLTKEAAPDTMRIIAQENAALGEPSARLLPLGIMTLMAALLVILIAHLR